MDHKVVFDSNVWISAILFGGKPKQAIDLALNKGQIFCSIYILEEIRDVLKENFNLPQDRIEELTEAILDITEIIPVTGELENIITDPKDNPIIETALLAKADFLVTGDKHILALRKYRNVQIITVGQFLKKL